MWDFLYVRNLFLLTLALKGELFEGLFSRDVFSTYKVDVLGCFGGRQSEFTFCKFMVCPGICSSNSEISCILLLDDDVTEDMAGVGLWVFAGRLLFIEFSSSFMKLC